MHDDPAGTGHSATEAYVEDLIKRSLDPHRDLWPPEVLEAYAEELRAFLYTHPVGSRMLARTQPDDRATSGDQPSAGQKPPAAPARPKGKVG